MSQTTPTRVVTVTGVPGVGKTTVGQALIKHCPPGTSALLDTDNIVGVNPWFVNDALYELGASNIAACLRGFRRWGATVVILSGVIVPEGYIRYLDDILDDADFHWRFYGLVVDSATLMRRISGDVKPQDAGQRQSWAHLETSVRVLPACRIVETGHLTAEQVALEIATAEGLLSPSRKSAEPRRDDIPDAGAVRELAQQARVAAGRLSDAGATPELAQRVADSLVTAEIDGYPSHGLLRIDDYLRDVESGALDPAATPETRVVSRSVRLIEGRRAFGVLVGDALGNALEEVAKESEVSAVIVRQTHHLGRLGPLVAPVAQRGLIVLGFANFGGAGQRVPPYGGAEGRLCTNPIVAAVPRLGDAPMVLDISTSTVAEGKVRQAVLRGQQVPAGWLVDERWEPVTDPRLLYTDPPAAMLTPLGGEQAGHKGWGLGLLVEILAGIVTGGGFSQSEPGLGGNNALFLGLAPERIRGVDAAVIAHEVEALLAYCLQVRPAPGRQAPRVPGDRSGRLEHSPSKSSVRHDPHDR